MTVPREGGLLHLLPLGIARRLIRAEPPAFHVPASPKCTQRRSEMHWFERTPARRRRAGPARLAAVTVDFERAVLATLRSLTPGEVVTYGEVAEQAGFPGAARAVGSLLRRTTEEVPWWRVVGSGGHLRAPDPRRQARLLRAEGVTVTGRRVRA